MAIGTVFLYGIGGKERLVLLSVNRTLWVTAHAERIDLWPREHDVRRRAVATGGPGFIGNVLVGFAMATCAADVDARMDKSNVLLHVVYVTDKATTVVSNRSVRLLAVRVIVKQQQRFTIKQQRGLASCWSLARCVFDIRRWFLLVPYLLTTYSHKKNCHQG